MADEHEGLAPQKQSLFRVTPGDILDGALENLDERQAREVKRKAADEVVRLAVEQRRAEHRGEAAREEMRAVVANANLLDQRGGDYTIRSTFETATGTTEVLLSKSRTTTTAVIIAAAAVALLLVILLFVLSR